LGHELAVGQQTFEHSVRQALELLLQLVIGEAGRLQGVGQRLLDHRVKVAQHDAVLGGEILVDGGVANAAARAMSFIVVPSKPWRVIRSTALATIWRRVASCCWRVVFMLLFFKLLISVFKE
jgi:hypothetical protein